MLTGIPIMIFQGEESPVMLELFIDGETPAQLHESLCVRI